jgi:hypothetical protein
VWGVSGLKERFIAGVDATARAREILQLAQNEYPSLALNGLAAVLFDEDGESEGVAMRLDEEVWRWSKGRVFLAKVSPTGHFRGYANGVLPAYAYDVNGILGCGRSSVVAHAMDKGSEEVSRWG